MVVQAEATNAGANTVGIVEIRSKEVNRSCCWKSTVASQLVEQRIEECTRILFHACYQQNSCIVESQHLFYLIVSVER